VTCRKILSMLFRNLKMEAGMHQQQVVTVAEPPVERVGLEPPNRRRGGTTMEPPRAPLGCRWKTKRERWAGGGRRHQEPPRRCY
jgi:hypothetical protein